MCQLIVLLVPLLPLLTALLVIPPHVPTVHGLQQSQQVSIEFGVVHESPPWWRKACIPETLPTENPEELKKFCVPPNIQPREYSQSPFLLNFLSLKEVACSLTPNILLTTNW